MIIQLKRKFIFTAMAGITVMLIILLGTLNLINIHSMYDDIDEDLSMLAESVDITLLGNTMEPDEFSTEILFEDPKSAQDTMLSSNFFIVRFDREGVPNYVNTNQITSLSEKQAVKLASKVRSHRKETGSYGKYQYHIATENDVQTIVFLDISNEIIFCLRVLLLSCVIGLVCWGLMLMLVISVSNWAIAPVEESIKKQKQFITDAGHELKTPIAVILSNIEALELYTGQTKWSGNIKKQSQHLTELVYNLLSLSRMDENAIINLEEFSVSEMMKALLETFQSAVQEKGLSLHYEIEGNVRIRADRSQMKNLISILLDNAVSYSNEGGDIWVRLSGKKQHAILQIENTCQELPDVPPEKLFERFYRADRSHKQSDGKCGIGLSIAEAIVNAHKGTIKACYLPENHICLTVKI